MPHHTKYDGSFIRRKAGAQVTVAEHGRIARVEALAARDRGESCDVISMDMQMPVMDGYETTHRLHAAGSAGPILALAAHAMERDDLQCRSADGDGCRATSIDRATFVPLGHRRVNPSIASERPKLRIGG